MRGRLPSAFALAVLVVGAAGAIAIGTGVGVGGHGGSSTRPVARPMAQEAPTHTVDTDRVSTTMQQPASPDAPPAPGHLDRPRQGADAIAALGDALPQVAAENGMSVGTFEGQLLDDHTVWLDSHDRLYVVEPLRTAAPMVNATIAPPSNIPDDQAFLLHSDPGAQRTIFLDFNGQLIQNTAWNGQYGTPSSFTAAPYDTDGNPSSFSSTELSVVKSVWARVSEDYSSFDVDVTTQEPDPSVIDRSGSTDQVYGQRAVITSGNDIYASCGCGGVSYVGVFNMTSSHEYYQPSWIFANGVPGPKNIAEAVSHEVGHSLGLSHDRTSTTSYYAGQGSWAPIMGVGYYEPISQWSKGEFADSANSEDDLAVMNAHGALTRADDFGDTPATATTETGPTFSVDGRITTRTDVDAFHIDANAGPATFTVTPNPTSPDLDASLKLLDANGTQVAYSDPPSSTVDNDVAAGMDATISTTLAGGSYTLVVDGVGNGDPVTTGYSDYASLGVYTLTGSVSTAPPPPDFGLSVTPATRAIATGVGTTYTVNLSSTNGYADPVSLSLTGAPANSTFSVNPPVWNGTTASSTLTIPASAATGQYAIKVSGFDGNGHLHTANVSLSVGADFAVGVTPSTTQLLPGKSATDTVKVTSVGSFASTVALTATGLPAGVTAAFSPTSVTPTASGVTSSMKVSASSSAKPGNYTFTVTSTGSDAAHTVHTTAVSVVIAGFTISLSQPSVTVTHGTSVSMTVTVTSFGSFSSAVSLSISNLPTGATAVFSPSKVTPTGTGATATLTITASSTARAAVKTASVKAQASGASQQLISLPVTIQ